MEMMPALGIGDSWIVSPGCRDNDLMLCSWCHARGIDRLSKLARCRVLKWREATSTATQSKADFDQPCKLIVDLIG